MTRRVGFSLVLLLACGPIFGVAPAADSTVQDEGETPFEEAQLFFELNDTDGDLGIHGLIDGGPWVSLTIEGPNDVRLLDVVSRSAFRRQGMTEVFFESSEPSFDELAPATFFRRFPEGTYDIEGVTQTGAELESEAVLSHIMPAPADNIRLSGVPAAEDCDAMPLPSVNSPVVIDWDPVTSSHPEIGKRGRISIARYQLIVERVGRVNFSVDLPPSVTRFTVPTDVTRLAREFKFEIIARATNGNNTAVESCFRVN